jgi:hypothetical protein
VLKTLAKSPVQCRHTPMQRWAAICTLGSLLSSARRISLIEISRALPYWHWPMCRGPHRQGMQVVASMSLSFWRISCARISLRGRAVAPSPATQIASLPDCSVERRAAGAQYVISCSAMWDGSRMTTITRRRAARKQWQGIVFCCFRADHDVGHHTPTRASFSPLSSSLDATANCRRAGRRMLTNKRAFTTPRAVSLDRLASSADCHKWKTNTNAG